jgi:RNA polymerase sigma-70 factor, ECF subfamily
MVEDSCAGARWRREQLVARLCKPRASNLVHSNSRSHNRHVETTLTATLNSAGQATAEGIAEDGFDEIVRQHQRRVYRVIFLLVRDNDAADTLTQECFLRAYRKRGGFRGECSVGTWLVRIAVNLARDHGKNRRLAFWRKTVGLQDENLETGATPNLAASQPSAEQVLLAREALQAVWSAAAALPQQQRTIFLLRFAEEMPLAEIAEVLDLEVGTVKAHLFRAIGKVKEIVKGTPCS